MREFRAFGVLAVLLCSASLAGCTRQAVVADSPTAQPTGTALLTADLNRINAQQADYAATNGRYAGSIGDLGFAPSDGVSVSVVQVTTAASRRLHRTQRTSARSTWGKSGRRVDM